MRTMFNKLYLRGLRFRSPKEENSDYSWILPIVRELSKQGDFYFNAPVTFFVGENGTGKSTLLEAIAVAYGFNAEGGSKNFNFSTSATHSQLHNSLTLIKGIQRPRDGFFLRAESFYNVASELDRLDEIAPIFNHYGGQSLHNQSHGESFMSLLNNRLSGKGLYLLDEPEAALSPQRQLALLVSIDNLVKNASQLIIATHSPILLAYPQAEILVLSQNGLTQTAYRDTEHYRLTKEFLNDPERMLFYLLKQKQKGADQKNDI